VLQQEKLEKSNINLLNPRQNKVNLNFMIKITIRLLGPKSIREISLKYTKLRMIKMIEMKNAVPGLSDKNKSQL
jgi:hypothetical protein